jgi:hypothetical protein
MLRTGGYAYNYVIHMSLYYCSDTTPPLFPSANLIAGRSLANHVSKCD